MGCAGIQKISGVLRSDAASHLQPARIGSQRIHGLLLCLFI